MNSTVISPCSSRPTPEFPSPGLNWPWPFATSLGLKPSVCLHAIHSEEIVQLFLTFWGEKKKNQPIEGRIRNQQYIEESEIADGKKNKDCVKLHGTDPSEQRHEFSSAVVLLLLLLLLHMMRHSHAVEWEVRKEWLRRNLERAGETNSLSLWQSKLTSGVSACF